MSNEELPAETPPNEVVNIDKLRTPATQGRGWRRMLWVIVLGITVLILLPVGIGLSRQSGLSNALSQLRFSSDPQQSISVVGTSDSGVVLFVEHRGVRELTLVVSNTLGTWNLSQGMANHAVPIISPHDDQIVFVVGESGKRQIKLANPHQLTEVLTDDSKVAGLGNANKLTGLQICDANSLRWSPDEHRLAFFVCAKDFSTILILDIVSKNLAFVANTSSSSARPRTLAWMDDNRIVFVEQTESDVDEAYIINADGTGKTLVVSGLQSP